MEIKWFGTDSGVYKFDGTFYNFHYKPIVVAQYDVCYSYIDACGNKWFGASGISCLDSSETTWTNYTQANSGLSNDDVHSIAIDAQGNKWFGTRGGGLSKFGTGTSTTVIFSVSSNAISLTPSKSSTTTFDITSNISWNVSSNQTWLAVSSLSGSNNASISIAASANNTKSPRTAIITVSGSGVTPKTITVTQAAANTSII